MNANDTLSETDKQTFAKSSIFVGLSAKEISPILSAIEIKAYDTDQTIMSSGDVGDGIYVVLEGQVKVFLPQEMPDHHGGSQTIVKISLATLDQGACFGEYSLVDQKEVSASVQALVPVRLAYLSTEDFRTIAGTHLQAENVIYKNLLKLLVSRCREANMELDGDFLIY